MVEEPPELPDDELEDEPALEVLVDGEPAAEEPEELEESDDEDEEGEESDELEAEPADELDEPDRLSVR